jgi:hypothetical protein
MEVGHGFGPTAGPGLVMNHGAGLRITTAAGFTTTTIGPGVRAVTTTEITVGGGPRSSLSTSHSAITFRGIRFPTTIEIRDRVTTRSRPRTGNRDSNHPREDEAFQKAVTSVTTSDFGGDGVRFQPASGIMARKIVADAPVTGDLPLKPANLVVRKGSSDIGRGDRVTVGEATREARPSTRQTAQPGPPFARWVFRSTPELRKARVFGGRESKTETTDRVVTDGAVESKSTGASHARLNQ